MYKVWVRATECVEHVVLVEKHQLTVILWYIVKCSIHIIELMTDDYIKRTKRLRFRDFSDETEIKSKYPNNLQAETCN